MVTGKPQRLLHRTPNNRFATVLLFDKFLSLQLLVQRMNADVPRQFVLRLNLNLFIFKILRKLELTVLHH